MADERLTTTERFRKGLDEFLGTTGAGLEEVVNTKAFGDILSQVTGNLVAVSRISGETLDLVIRNARLAGRKDVAELGRQLGRTEDKLEAVLALVEDLQSDLRAAREENAALRAQAVEPPAPARKTTARKSSTED